MPVISFDPGFLDALLRGDKQQTTRKPTARIKVGDTAQIYIKQRAKITDKPVRVMTDEGMKTITDRVNDAQYNYPAKCPRSPFRDKFEPVYYAHILGKVYITEVYDMLPAQNSSRSQWAKADGFTNFTCADTWFTERYGEEWVDKWWTVIRWDEWQERYFLADESDAP